MKAPEFSRLAGTALLIIGSAARAPAAPGDLLGGFLPFSTIAPQDITRDDADGTFWISAFLDDRIYHFSSDLERELGTIPSPFGDFEFTTGITYNPYAQTLLVTNAVGGQIIEIERDGSPTGQTIDIPIVPGGNPFGVLFRGLCFDAAGDAGRGSVYVVESSGTAFYEISLDGRLLRHFGHPEDADGFPGQGDHAAAADIEVIRDAGALRGFLVTTVTGPVPRLLRLDAAGDYTGAAVPLDGTGGNVSGVLCRPFRVAGGQEAVPALICVVDSNARLAVLESGEPELREIFGLICREDGATVSLEWTSRQDYDHIEVLRGCEVLDVLPGDADHWSRRLETDGVYELSVRAVSAFGSSVAGPCVLVIGPGAILRGVDSGNDGFLADLAPIGSGFLAVTDAVGRRLVYFDLELRRLGTVDVDPGLVAEGEFITGLAPSRDPDQLYVYNTSTHVVGKVDFTGELVEAFAVALPNLEEDPAEEVNRGLVWGMELDPAGNGGQGSLWIVESVRDHVYEIALDGQVLRDLPHPYLTLDPPPPDSGLGAFTTGISLVPGRSGELALSGGTFRDGFQRYIARVDIASWRIVAGSEVPTAAVRQSRGGRSLMLQLVATGAAPRLVVLAPIGRGASLLEIDAGPAAIAPVTYAACRQSDRRDAVELSFHNNGPYDAVEVLRDCELIASLDGASTRYVDSGAPPGVRSYRLRGLRGGAASDIAECTLRVGTGAVLARSLTAPALGAQQLTVDPVGDRIHVVTNYPGDERRVHIFGADLAYIETRDSVVETPWEIATLAIRVRPDSGRSYYYITWLQPVPLGGAGRERFLLVEESIDGVKLGEVEISPPRPVNGFVTFPTALCWDAGTDTFLYLERNTGTYVEMSPDGETLRTFPHPARPFQNFVFALGLTAVPERGTFFLTTAGDREHTVTKILEMDRSGRLTGLAIPLTVSAGDCRGIAASGADLIAIGYTPLTELLRLKASEPPASAFLRGDSDRSGRIELTDAVVTLQYLFLGRQAPLCLDAADVNDDGRVDLTDPVGALNFLFRGGRSPAPPFPVAGEDPTPDALGEEPGACS